MSGAEAYESESVGMCLTHPCRQTKSMGSGPKKEFDKDSYYLDRALSASGSTRMNKIFS